MLCTLKILRISLSSSSSLNETIEDSAKVLEMDHKITTERYKVNYLEGNLSKYQATMMATGKSDITQVDIDNQVLAQIKLLGVNLDKE